ncbi:3-isopropylmalate dehydratase large subunit, chloroplastic, partial [Olea europaea subsp. europaea]
LILPIIVQTHSKDVGFSALSSQPSFYRKTSKGLQENCVCDGTTTIRAQTIHVWFSENIVWDKVCDFSPGFSDLLDFSGVIFVNLGFFQRKPSWSLVRMWVNVDILMTHDVCGPGAIGIFNKEFGEDAKVWDREKLLPKKDIADLERSCWVQTHTRTAGAFGQFATGIGNTDAGFVLGTGKLLLKVPPTLRFVMDGEMPDYLLV